MQHFLAAVATRLVVLTVDRRRLLTGWLLGVPHVVLLLEGKLAVWLSASLQHVDVLYYLVHVLDLGCIQPVRVVVVDVLVSQVVRVLLQRASYVTSLQSGLDRVTRVVLLAFDEQGLHLHGLHLFGLQLQTKLLGISQHGWDTFAWPQLILDVLVLGLRVLVA